MPNNTNDDTPTGRNSRRRVLKTALMGGASITAFKLAPESWTRPVVEAVSLPAHAQTSLALPDGPWSSGGESDGPGPARDRGLGDRLLNAILPEAQAGKDVLPPLIPFGCGFFGICIEKVDDNTIFVRVGFDGIQFDSGNVNVSVRGGLLTFNDSFGLLNVNGELSADGEIWTGRVEGLCPFIGGQERLQQSSSRGPLGRFGTALADAVVSSARAGLEEDLAAEEIDAPWEAQKNVPCGLSNEI